MSHVRRDHPRCRDSTRICMCGHTREAVILVSSKSVQGVLNLYSAKNREDESEAHGVKICPFPLGLLWRLAFTAAQAVMYNNVEKQRNILTRDFDNDTLSVADKSQMIIGAVCCFPHPRVFLWDDHTPLARAGRFTRLPVAECNFPCKSTTC